MSRAATGHPNNWMNAPRPLGFETPPQSKRAREYDPWTDPAHLPPGALAAMRLRHLLPIERERLAYTSGDIDAANVWAQVIDAQIDLIDANKRRSELDNDNADLEASLGEFANDNTALEASIDELKRQIDQLTKGTKT